MEENQQNLQRVAAAAAAAAAYDYNNDPRWAEYWSNVLIPPYLASRPDVILHFKLKFYQRYIDPDLVVEPMFMGSSSSGQPQSSPTSSFPGSSSISSRTPGPSTSPTSLYWDWQTIQFTVDAWVFGLAVLAIFPLMPRKLSNRAYRLSFMGYACSSLYSLYSLYGKPRAWNMQAVQVWGQSAIVAKDFMYFIYPLIFVSSNVYLKLAVIPVLCRALEHVAKFLKHNFSGSTLYRRYLEEACIWVESNTINLSILTSHTEIGLGFLLILALFSWQRNVMNTFIYWQLLRLMYHAPATAGYHRIVWAKIGRTIYPTVCSYAPFLKAPISAFQRWWFR